MTTKHGGRGVKVLIFQDGQKVFKQSGSRDKVERSVSTWFKFK